MKPFYFNWGAFNVWAGLKYITGMLLLMLISRWVEFPLFLVGVSAILVWLVDMSGKEGSRIQLIILYLVIGTALTLLSNLLAATYWPWLICMFIVTFSCTFLLRFGSNWFMLGWSLILWFMLMPVLGSVGNPQEIVLSHILGTVSVLLLVVAEILFIRYRNKSPKEDVKPEKEEPVQHWMVFRYSLVVALMMVVGLMVGHKWFDSDPTMISNAAFMIIGFSMINTWKAGLERIIAFVFAISIGFYLGVLLQNETFGIILSLTASFFVLAFLAVNNGIVMFFFILYISYRWGLNDFETGNTIANVRIIAEIAGVFLAGFAITIMNILNKYIKPKDQFQD